MAFSINNSGQAVGWATTYGYSNNHAALFSNGNVIDLGILKGGTTSGANSINNSGQAVGWAYTAAGDERATLYSNGAVIDLNSFVDSTLGLYLVEGTGINDAGQIVANGYANGQAHAFLLTPTPIPAAFPLFGSGLVSLWVLSRKRGKLD